MVVKAINRMKKPEEPVAEEPTTKECPFCKSQVAIAATRCPHCTSSLE
jgi:large conductance mechanosensitive channel